MKDNIPYKSFTVENLQEKYKQLLEKKVKFTTPPTDAGTVILAVFDDTCGNLIQIIQHKNI